MSPSWRNPFRVLKTGRTQSLKPRNRRRVSAGGLSSAAPSAIGASRRWEHTLQPPRMRLPIACLDEPPAKLSLVRSATENCPARIASRETKNRPAGTRPVPQSVRPIRKQRRRRPTSRSNSPTPSPGRPPTLATRPTPARLWGFCARSRMPPGHP